MFKSFIKQRRSWIILILLLQVLLLFIAFIDPLIPLTSILYIVFLSLIIFILFLSIRFYKETSFYQQIKDNDASFDMLERLANGPFEKMVQERFLQQEKDHERKIRANRHDVEREKDELMAWIHEVKTPLTSMHLMIDRVEDAALKQQLMVEWIRLDLLLDQQLHQRRVPFIENDYSVQRLHLESLVTQEVKHLRAWCIQKGIGFDISIETREVYSDETWIRFIIRQLVTNAVKYSDETDITITSVYTDGYIQLDIKDVGKGISKKDLPRIFEKGFTSTLETRDQAATGMGLYLVKKVADHLRITIDVESVLDAGTIVRLTFPKQNEMMERMSM